MKTTPALTICTKHLSRTKTTLQPSNYAIGTSRATTLDPLQLEQPELRPPWCLYHATFSTATFDEGLTQTRYRNGFVPTYASIILFDSAQSGLLRIELNQLLQFLWFQGSYHTLDLGFKYYGIRGYNWSYCKQKMRNWSNLNHKYLFV